MAQSRRRERELARRRFERRRMAEMQRRAERRRRMNRIAAVVSVVLVIGLVVGLALALTGGGGKKLSAAGKPTSTPTPSVATSSPAAPSVPNPTTLVAKATKRCAPVKPNPPVAGEPKFRNIGKVPKKLQVIDLKQGTGAVAKSGDTVTMKYVGVGCSSGKFFDASYTDGAANQEFQPFTLGQGAVIPGWDQGIPGMKVGGVRELVIPPALAYGARGSAPTIGKNAPLLFVVTLDKVSK